MTRKPSKATQAKHQRLLDAANEKRQAASSAVTTWAIANGFGNVRWKDLVPILKERVPALFEAEQTALQDMKAAEEAAIKAWTHYRGIYGLIFKVSH